MLVHGLASKNNRTRVEAAEAIAEIIHDEGVHVADKARHKPLPALAQVSRVEPLIMQPVCLAFKHVQHASKHGQLLLFIAMVTKHMQAQMLFMLLKLASLVCLP